MLYLIHMVHGQQFTAHTTTFARTQYGSLMAYATWGMEHWQKQHRYMFHYGGSKFGNTSKRVAAILDPGTDPFHLCALGGMQVATRADWCMGWYNW